MGDYSGCGEVEVHTPICASVVGRGHAFMAQAVRAWRPGAKHRPPHVNNASMADHAENAVWGGLGGEGSNGAGSRVGQSEDCVC